MSPGRGKLPIVLLAVSLCFNAFFIIGYSGSRAVLKQLRTDEGRIHLIARQIGLSKQQEEQFVNLRAELQKERERYETANRAETDAFWDEMSKDNPDIEKIKALLRASAQKREALRLVTVEYMSRAFRLITPDQRIALAKMIRERSFYKQL
jgi:Spy/CpxP family protein refolding chaperone